jgi:hypothetical protein
MKLKPVIILVAALSGLAAFAAPAPWYKWRSKVDGAEFCTQISPGEGWEKSAGPYKDAHCKNPSTAVPS